MDGKEFEMFLRAVMSEGVKAFDGRKLTTNERKPRSDRFHVSRRKPLSAA